MRLPLFIDELAAPWERLHKDVTRSSLGDGRGGVAIVGRSQQSRRASDPAGSRFSYWILDGRSTLRNYLDSTCSYHLATFTRRPPTHGLLTTTRGSSPKSQTRLTFVVSSGGSSTRGDQASSLSGIEHSVGDTS
jgi:hypothetical protein